MRMTRGALAALILVLVAINFAVWQSVLLQHAGTLRVSVLDIGQGDSILVQGPTGIQMLIDGGPDHSVLRELPREMGLLDRSIDLLVETHPDKDHIAGLAYVLQQYAVSYFMSPGIPNSTAVTYALNDAVKNEKGLQSFTARRGMRIHLGSGAYADVLYPDQDVSHLETNEGSVTMHIVYGSTSFMMSGDLPSDKEEYLVGLDGADGNLKSDVLKAGHHGSKNSSSDAWLAAVHPSIVAISAGKGNTYGHPNPEAIARIKNEGAQIASTIDSGTLDFISDGKTITEKTER
ncbi:MAG TPA: MBL fold metallo-hydrolase [Candidatus Paceibacterota bacterium]|jgi:beta-lactamase superfamily II metal-dependent hydrolase|nr:MBL fold metallo-hydrolase [Candidatus Paceibacterota bacterium]